MAGGPFELVRHMAGIFDELGVPYALGGSMASSLLGEPRSTVDVDMAVVMDVATGEALLERVGPEFYVPFDSARTAIRQRTSFNLVDTVNALKVDVFVLGDGLLDRMQIERRILVDVPGTPTGIWVTSAEDQVLRKLDWYRKGDRSSDRQWRDIVGILRVHGAVIDRAYLLESAQALDLVGDLEEALRQSGVND
jgi:hypothetical protein